MTRNPYNGWTNFETWAVALWLDNDEYTQSEVLGMARNAFESAKGDHIFSKADRAKLDLAESLKEMHDENMPEAPGVYGDLLGAALSEVDWHEIASGYILQVVEEDKEMMELANDPNGGDETADSKLNDEGKVIFKS